MELGMNCLIEKAKECIMLNYRVDFDGQPGCVFIFDFISVQPLRRGETPDG